VKYVLSTAVLVVGEGLAALVFYWLRKKLDPPRTGTRHDASVVKGILERLVVLVGLLAGFPQILTAFGALKISTRLIDDQSDHISNTYFLVGNLLSLLLAMTYAWAINLLLR
jgi:hypothetical protein